MAPLLSYRAPLGRYRRPARTGLRRPKCRPTRRAQLSPGYLTALPVRGRQLGLSIEICCPRGLSAGGNRVSRTAAAACCQITFSTSDQAGLPAELKHISKRRKRN